MWLVNDSGGDEIVYGVDESGETVAELRLQSIYNRDWEAMAPGVDESGDPALWVGDIGDNDAQWSSIRAYRIPEPAQLGKQDVPWRRVELRYPDGAHNAETMMVDDSGRIYVVTKEAIGAGVYVTPECTRDGHHRRARAGGSCARCSSPMERSRPTVLRWRCAATRRSSSTTQRHSSARGPTGTQEPSTHCRCSNKERPSPTSSTARASSSAARVSSSRSMRLGSHAKRPTDLLRRHQSVTTRAARQWALGLAVVLVVSGVAALVMRKRGRVRQASSPTT